MPEIRLLTTVTVERHRLDDFRALMAAAAAESTAEVDDPSTGQLGYSAHLDAERGEVVLFEHHASYEAFVAHLGTNPERRRRMRDLCTPVHTAILGDAPAELLAALAGLGLATVHYPEQLASVGLA